MVCISTRFRPAAALPRRCGCSRSQAFGPLYRVHATARRSKLAARRGAGREAQAANTTLDGHAPPVCTREAGRRPSGGRLSRRTALRRFDRQHRAEHCIRPAKCSRSHFRTPLSVRHVLAFGSHSDDIEIGCGATLLALTRRGPRSRSPGSCSALKANASARPERAQRRS